MSVSVNTGVAGAVRRALATCAVAICGAGSLAAYAQQPPVSGDSSNKVQLARTDSIKPGKAHPAQAGSKSSKKVLLAQVSSDSSKRLVLAQVGSDSSKELRLAAASSRNPDEIQVAQASTAATSNPSNAQALQEVVITGSLIQRANLETPNPVQILTSKDLVQSGYTDISDVLRNIPSNGASTLSQSFSFAFAAGASGISLRGLSLGDTLVLIDGQRSVPYPLLDDNERSFVDLSSIPFTAIDQVQVLKDGGSALYGSDAVAGVVNVILKKEYQGFHVSAEAGTSQHWDGTMQHLGFIGGHGELASDGYNWYVSGDFRHQDQILAANRSGQWVSRDFTGFGGFNATPGVSVAQNPNVPFPATLTGYLINPNSADGTPFAYLPGCDATAQALNRCLVNTSTTAQLQPASTNIDLLAKFTKALSGDWQLGLQASWFDSKSEQVSSFQGNGFGNGTSFAAGGITNIGLLPGQPANVVTYPIITVPADYPGNPFGAPAPLIYNFPELGAQNSQVTTNTYRLLATLSGNAAGWDIDATAGAMYAKMDLSIFGNLEPAALQNALNNGYILGSSTGAQLFAPKASTNPTSQLDLINVHGTHKLFDMPGGPLNLALGVQWYKELHDETPPPTVGSAVQAGDSIFVIGTEYDRAVFAELEGSPIKQLEIDLQARYDNYKTFGSDTTPKIGVKFTPWKWVSLRGTYGKGFRAPSAAEGVSSGETFGAGTFQDTTRCPTGSAGGGITSPGDFPSQCELGLTGVLTANPHLKNVTSTNWTTGLVLQPIQQFSATIDYYNIKVDNDIVPSFQTGEGLNAFTSLVRGPQVTLPFCPPTNTGGCTTSQLVPALTPVGTILEAEYPYLNASSTHVSGYDVDLAYQWDAGSFGRFTGEAVWTHELTYQIAVAGSTFELAGTHGPSGVSGDTGNPKDRINVRLSWNKGPLTITPSMNYISHFDITDPSAGVNTCADGLGFGGNFDGGSVAPNQQQFCTVKYFLETDVYGSYQLSDKFEVHAAVTNLFNKQPPVDVQTYGSGSLFYPYDAALHQDGAVGRFFLVGFDYDF